MFGRIDRHVINAAGFSLSDMGIGSMPSGGPANYHPSCRGRRYYENGAHYRFEILGTITGQCGTQAAVSMNARPF